MKAYLKHMDNESAVSPIVATLVLIVVAVVGAVAVGTIMGAFSSDVSNQVGSGDVASNAQTEIIISGSTTVQPASELLAKEYMKDNSGVKVTVMGGGSDAGLAAINMKVVDIGSASKTADATKYPDLVGYQVGGSAVVWINNGVSTVLNQSDLLAAYADCGASNGTVISAHNSIPAGTTLFQRSEGSGTEETAAEWVGGAFKTAKNFDASNAAKKEGNAGILAAVLATTNSIGFVDYGYAVDASTGNANVAISAVDANGDSTADSTVVAKGGDAKTLKAEILAGLKGTATFPTKQGASAKDLTRPLMYYTNGEPAGIVKDYIQFAMSPAGTKSVEDAGGFHIISIKA